jgi:hypothetical protein
MGFRTATAPATRSSGARTGCASAAAPGEFDSNRPAQSRSALLGRLGGTRLGQQTRSRALLGGMAGAGGPPEVVRAGRRHDKQGQPASLVMQIGGKDAVRGSRSMVI